jgi:hypothetical protein
MLPGARAQCLFLGGVSLVSSFRVFKDVQATNVANKLTTNKSIEKIICSQI